MLNIAESLQRASDLQRNGKIEHAEAVCRAILQHEPLHVQANHLAGVLALQRGRADQGLVAFDHCLLLDPHQANVHVHRGVALQTLQRHAEAIASYDRALSIDSTHAVAWSNRANSLLELARPAEALASYEQAVSFDPAYANAWSNRANALLQLDRAAESLQSAERALQLNPHSALALNNRCNALLALGRFGEALVCAEVALRLVPNWPLVLVNRSAALHKLGRPEQALESAEQALALGPRDCLALNARANALRDLGRWSESLATYDSALRCNSNFPVTHFNRGNLLLDLRRHGEALEGFDHALRCRPNYAHAHYARGTTLLRLGQSAAASAAFASAVDLAPELPYARGLLLHSQLLQADWSRYDELRTVVISAVREGRQADEPFSFLSICDSAPAQLQCALRYGADKYPVQPALWRGQHWQQPRIRIGYLSGDLREHPVSYLLAGVFEQLDRTRFEVFALALQPAAVSCFGRRVASAFDHFVDLTADSDLAAAQRIHALQIDIVVDLTGLTRGTRPGILAHRPAPAQISYLGYPGTSGAPYLHYLLADEFVAPAQASPHYSEKLIHLHGCFQANDDQRVIGPVVTRADAGLAEHAMVFCSFNNTFKINPALFDVWCRTLLAVKDGVLWLLAEDESARANLRREADRRGVDPRRLIFAERIAYPQHLARLRLADLVLDTLPFNGGATTSDALWAGVPVITCAGEAFAGRMAGSLLHAVGLPELVTSSVTDYEQRCLEVASDRARLGELRNRLQANRSSCPAFDTARICRQLATAYEQVWERTRADESPASFSVS
jgi:protein O-GlcNAc transferase